MRHLPVVLTAVSLLAAGTARADFVVTQPGHGPGAAATTDNAADTQPTDESRSLGRPKPQPMIPLARGFGRRVPLAFAVRQIVPPSIHTTYGPGADPDALVDWTGGVPWPRVLNAAVQPLALHLVLGPGRVELRH